MGDPERLLRRTSDLDELERGLLRSVRDVAPPLGAKAQAWQGISKELAAAALVGAAATAASASAAANSAALTSGALAAKSGVLSSIAGKVVLLAVSGAALTSGTFWIYRNTLLSDSASTPREVQKLVASARVKTPSLEPTKPEPVPIVASSPSVRKLPVEAKPRDSLHAESTLLSEARRALRSGDVRSAELTLKRLRQQFPQGMLGQEREVLAIEVLSARGNSEAANRRARAFVAAHPNSPHNEKLERFLSRVGHGDQ